MNYPAATYGFYPAMYPVAGFSAADTVSGSGEMCPLPIRGAMCFDKPVWRAVFGPLSFLHVALSLIPCLSSIMALSHVLSFLHCSSLSADTSMARPIHCPAYYWWCGGRGSWGVG